MVPLVLVLVSAGAMSFIAFRCDSTSTREPPTLDRILHPEEPTWTLEPSTGCLHRSPAPIYGSDRHCYQKVTLPDGGKAW